ncbi:hypothetical protein DFH06DRAFT_710305 [Mycena polygramma]|nr:hypothetical protein DFH06DRAFT_710305 [Mycena polygramma]
MPPALRLIPSLHPSLHIPAQAPDTKSSSHPRCHGEDACIRTRCLRRIASPSSAKVAARGRRARQIHHPTPRRRYRLGSVLGHGYGQRAAARRQRLALRLREGVEEDEGRVLFSAMSPVMCSGSSTRSLLGGAGCAGCGLRLNAGALGASGTEGLIAFVARSVRSICGWHRYRARGSSGKAARRSDCASTTGGGATPAPRACPCFFPSLCAARTRRSADGEARFIVHGAGLVCEMEGRWLVDKVSGCASHDVNMRCCHTCHLH